MLLYGQGKKQEETKQEARGLWYVSKKGAAKFKIKNAQKWFD